MLNLTNLTEDVRMTLKRGSGSLGINAPKTLPSDAAISATVRITLAVLAGYAEAGTAHEVLSLLHSYDKYLNLKLNKTKSKKNKRNKKQIKAAPKKKSKKPRTKIIRKKSDEVAFQVWGQ